ncbi:magnesium transporter [Campylobacter blaseri]|uniref:Magnesium transporter MgtE n=1 Tax=Campylobacter blaseri TaxID=2042961 RepID=A0A2P8R057_9BACT|nr:magnesium transporter [Campylobacter blaseri]PSM53653.1 magnesium transporter [Campylobacter blaseri]
MEGLEDNEELLEAKALLDSHINDTIEDEMSGVDIVECLKIIKRHDEKSYFEYLHTLDIESLSNASIEMPDYILKDVIDLLPKDKLVEVVEDLESDDQFEFLENIDEIDGKKAREIFDDLSDEDKKDILKLSRYEDNQAGSYMQIELFKANANETVMEAVDRLRDLRHADEIDYVYHLFVVDDKDVLKYSIPLADLIIYNFSLTLEEVVRSAKNEDFRPRSALDTDDINEVASEFQEHDMSVMPVVDSRGVLVGRITSDDIYDFIQESATEQIYNLAGLNDEAEEEDISFAKAGKARAFWLCINLVTAFLASFIIGFFDATLQKYVALAILMPIVASMGGNVGIQALTVTVRRLALGEIEYKDAKKVLKREISIAVINGAIFAIAVALIASLWFKDHMLGVVIGLSMIINLSIAGFCGAAIPIILKKFKIDPAVGSSIILTMMTDIIGFFSFLGLATWILV